MALQAGFIETGDPRWLAAMSMVSHDFYHLPDYTAFSAKHAGGKGCAFLGQSNGAILFIPLVLRSMPCSLDVPSNWQDAMSPYGYASPLAVPGDTLHEDAELWQSFRECCRQRSIIAAFLRFHPLLPIPLASQSIGVMIEEGQTVFIDLTASREEILQQMRDNHLRDIRRLRNGGFLTAFDDWSGLDHFIMLYRETMRRAGAAEEYIFDDKYFKDLAAIDENNIHLCSIMAPDGRMAAAGLFFSCGGIVQFHLSGTSADFLSYSPTKLMFDDMSIWAKERGYKSLHLGGGVGCRNDSLFKFKAGFSTCRAVYHSLRVVCETDNYALLTEMSSGTSNIKQVANGFFPAYRQSRFS